MRVLSDRLLRLVRDPYVSHALHVLMESDQQAMTVTTVNGQRVTVRKVQEGQAEV